MSDGAAEYTLVPNPRPRFTSTVTKLMHELKVAKGERDELKLELARLVRLSDELQATEEERDEALLELGTVQDELSCVKANAKRYSLQSSSCGLIMGISPNGSSPPSPWSRLTQSPSP